MADKRLPSPQGGRWKDPALYGQLSSPSETNGQPVRRGHLAPDKGGPPASRVFTTRRRALGSAVWPNGTDQWVQPRHRPGQPGNPRRSSRRCSPTRCPRPRQAPASPDRARAPRTVAAHHRSVIRGGRHGLWIGQTQGRIDPESVSKRLRYLSRTSSAPARRGYACPCHQQFSLPSPCPGHPPPCHAGERTFRPSRPENRE